MKTLPLLLPALLALSVRGAAAPQSPYSAPLDPAPLATVSLQGSELLVTGPPGLPALVLIGPARPTLELARNVRLEVEVRDYRAFGLDESGRARLSIPASARETGYLAQVLVFDETGSVAVVSLAPRRLDVQGSVTTSGLRSGDRGGAAPCHRFCPGCEDLPDAEYVDSNCDGIDGDASRAIFVDEIGGRAGGAGTRNDPITDLQLAVDRAAATPGVDHVYVSTGAYPGPIRLAEGVSIWGGFDAADGWSRAADHLVVVHNVNAVRESIGVAAVRGEHLVAPIVLGDLRLEAWGAGPLAGANGSHAFGLHLWDVADLTLERVVSSGTLADHGRTGFSGGTGSTSHYGGAGGRGGTSSNLPGTGGTGGGSLCGLGGLGGLGGAPYFGGFDGTTGVPGLPSTTIASASFGKVSISGPNLLATGDGGKGGDGCPGGAGGGGGGGGYAPFIGNGGKGGSGGRGGRAGLGGFGGQRGGSSIGVFLSSAHIEAIDCMFVGQLGGWGGTGGAGGAFTSGSAGSKGQLVSGPDGGDGGPGAAGGLATPGGPGAGGHCYGVIADRLSTSVLTGTDLQAMTPGIPGPLSIPVGYSGEAVLYKQL